MTRRNIVHIEIPALNPRRTGKFYQKLFGWRVIHDEEQNYIFWDPQQDLGGGFPALGAGFKPGEVLIAVNSDDIDADLKKVVRMGGTVMIEKTEIPSVGWYATFTDPTGNNISLFTGAKAAAQG